MAVSFWDKVAAMWTGKRPEYYDNKRRQRKQNKGKEQTSLVGQGLGDIIDKYGNMGADENGVRTSAGNSRGDSFNNTQLAEMQYNHDEAQIDRQWQEDMYRKYQSPEAQMRQYDDAGLNRALAYNGGVDINGPSGGSAASADVANGGETPANGFQSAMGVMSTIMEMLLGGSNLATNLKSINNQSQGVANDSKRTSAEVTERTATARKANAEAAGIEIENQWKNLKNALQCALDSQDITKKEYDNALTELSLARESDPEVFAARKAQILADLGLTEATTTDISENRKTENRKAGAAERQAGAAERQADVSERNATTNEKNSASQIALNKSIEEVNNAVKTDKDYRNALNKYANDNNLPMDSPEIVAYHKELSRRISNFYGDIHGGDYKDLVKARNVINEAVFDHYRNKKPLNSADILSSVLSLVPDLALTKKL